MYIYLFPREPITKVRLGEWDLSSEAEPYPFVDISIDSIKVHPEFNPLLLHNDIAIIKLAKPPSFNKKDFPHINSACLTAPDVSFEGKR